LERGDVMKRSYRPSLFAFWGGGIDEEVMQALPVPPFGEGGLMRRSCRIHCDPKRSNVSYRKKLDEANVHARLTAIVIQPTEKRKRRVEPPHRGKISRKYASPTILTPGQSTAAAAYSHSQQCTRTVVAITVY